MSTRASFVLGLGVGLSFVVACGSSSTGSSGGGSSGTTTGPSGSTGTASSSGASGTTGSSGTSGTTTGPLARATLVSTLAKCEGTSNGEAYDVGSFTPDRPVDDNASDNGHLVSVTCTVAPTTGGYHVVATLSSEGALELDATVDTNGATTTAALTITKTTGTGTWTSSTCKLQPTGASQGVAAGRIWTDFTCIGAAEQSTTESCDLSGTIRLENCSQKN